MIIEGYITIDNEYDNMPRINNESICSYLEKLITNERCHKGINTGYVKWKDKGLGEKHYYLKDCKMRAYYSRERCSLEEAQNAMVSYLCGDIKGSGYNTGYSEWTILGFKEERDKYMEQNNELMTEIANFYHKVDDVIGNGES